MHIAKAALIIEVEDTTTDGLSSLSKIADWLSYSVALHLSHNQLASYMQLSINWCAQTRYSN